MRVYTLQVGKELNIKELRELSQAAGAFQSDIFLYLQNETVKIDVKSLLGLLLQIIPAGTLATIKTIGTDESEALESMIAMIQ